MFVGARGSLFTLVAWQWRYALTFAIAGTLCAVAHQVFDLKWLVLPSLPLAVAGAALSIFVSFRTNTAYNRWWEGRQLWGRIVNGSRTFSTQVLAYLPREEGKPSAVQRQLVLRVAGWVHVLRCALREQDPFADPRVQATLDESDLARLRGQNNPAHALVHEVLLGLAAEADAGRLGEERLRSLDQTIQTLLDQQGGCERIKRTPMPRGYGFIADRLILAFGLLFPFAVVDDLGWITIPINLVVCLAFALISEVGRVLEDPFTMFYNALPLSQLSTMIEVNLRQRLGDSALPEIPKPTAQGVLM